MKIVLEIDKEHLIAFEKLVGKLVARIIVVTCILFLFIFAMELTRKGVTSSIGDYVYQWADTFLISPGKAFLFAYLSGIITLSGTTAAALGISLSAADIVPPDSVFHLIMGSRMAPNVILFFVGFLALLKGRTLYRSIGLGFIEYCVTVTVIAMSYVISMLPFIQNLARTLADRFSNMETHKGIIEAYIDPGVALFNNMIGGSLTFMLGIGLLVLSIRLFDKFFSFVDFEEKDDRVVRKASEEYVWSFIKKPLSFAVYRLKRMGQKIKSLVRPNFKQRFRKHLQEWLSNPFNAFLLGLIITTLTMSNAVSITLILPFYIYKTIDIRAAVPYILGATISTYLDTFFLAIISGTNSNIYSVMLALISAIITTILFALLFRFYLYLISTLTHQVFKYKWLVATFIILIVAVPGILLYAP